MPKVLHPSYLADMKYIAAHLHNQLNIRKLGGLG